ncbi:MAG: hypothetical protein E6I84_16955 [Chloroflexi bacterium]|nr:MAG: hypothetical protein E6I84_16955 [Chloroflexota bacterium]
MSEPVRWGLLSTARINNAILDGASQSERTDVIAVASRDRGRAESYARERGIERAYGSYAGLLEDANVEVVYVPLPNSLHVEWSLRALEAGSTSCARSRCPGAWTPWSEPSTPRRVRAGC